MTIGVCAYRRLAANPSATPALIPHRTFRRLNFRSIIVIVGSPFAVLKPLFAEALEIGDPLHRCNPRPEFSHRKRDCSGLGEICIDVAWTRTPGTNPRFSPARRDSCPSF